MNYANAKLTLGILNVGLWVLVSLAILIGPTELPLPGEAANTYELIGGIFVIYLFYILIQFPFDIAGGIAVPLLFGKLDQNILLRLLTIVRAISIQGMLFVSVGCLFVIFTQTLGLFGTILIALTTQTLYLFCQSPLAQLISDFHVTKCTDPFLNRYFKIIHNHSDEFTGGISGAPGLERVYLPATWLKELRSELKGLLGKRYELIQKNGERTRGIALALLWNLSGVVLVCLFITQPDSAARLAYFIASFSLWSFLGLLLLPTASKTSTFAIDRDLLAGAENKDLFEELITFVSQKSGEKESRFSVEERIFHPAPSIRSRLRALDTPQSPHWFRGWNVSRTALFLSNGCLNILTRSVHGNVGRPDLYIFMPVE